MLDREGIKKLMATHTQGRLVSEFGISRPTLRYYMKGKEPKHPWLTEFINAKVRMLLAEGKK